MARLELAEHDEDPRGTAGTRRFTQVRATVRCKTLLLLGGIACAIGCSRVQGSEVLAVDRTGLDPPPLYGGCTAPFIVASVLFPENTGGKGSPQGGNLKGNRRRSYPDKSGSSPGKDPIRDARVGSLVTSILPHRASWSSYTKVVSFGTCFGGGRRRCSLITKEENLLAAPAGTALAVVVLRGYVTHMVGTQPRGPRRTAVSHPGGGGSRGGRPLRGPREAACRRRCSSVVLPSRGGALARLLPSRGVLYLVAPVGWAAS